MFTGHSLRYFFGNEKIGDLMFDMNEYNFM